MRMSLERPDLPAKRSVPLFIQECAFMLGAKDLTTATACVLFQKCTRAMQSSKNTDESTHNSISHDPFLVATTCLFLAGKVEEDHLNLRRLVNVAFKKYFKDRELLDMDEFQNIRSSVLQTELWILRLIGFNPNISHPHMFLACLLKSTLDWLPREVCSREPLAAVCWSLLKDSYLSDMALNYKAEHIAVAIVAVGLRMLRVSIPCESAAGRPWVESCCADLSTDTLNQIATELVAIYEEKVL